MRELKKNQKQIAIALGYFDCVHYAHRQIIADVVKNAMTNDFSSAVLTFSNELSSKGTFPLYAYKERKRLICDVGADFILPFHFDDAFKSLSANDFLAMLANDYSVKYIACGSDYRFGRGGEGNVEILKSFAEKNGIKVKIFEPITMDGEVVSSTLIKNELSFGNITKANKLLCSPYFFEGKVTRGKGRGQSMGYPTANLKPASRFIPKFGVYKSRTMAEGRIYDSLTSIGNKPTFQDDNITVETFIKGEIFNLYSKNICVELIDFVRELTRFESVAELKAQIKSDIEGI